jgi:integrase
VRRHAYPTPGDRSLSSILPSHVQAWVRSLEVGGGERRSLAPAAIGVVHALVSRVFKAAVRDRRVVANPCEGTKLPKASQRKVVPPTTEQVEALAERLRGELAALVTFVAGTGMRQGEVFGLTVDRVDMLRPRGACRSAAPRRGYRATTDLGSSEDRGEHPNDPASADPRGRPRGPSGAILRRGELAGVHHRRASVTRQRFGHLWRPLTKDAGLPARTGLNSWGTTTRACSPLGSVKTVQEGLGHASAAETLDTYSHLWPDSDDRPRQAVDSVLGPLADSLRSPKAL